MNGSADAVLEYVLESDEHLEMGLRVLPGLQQVWPHLMKTIIDDVNRAVLAIHPDWQQSQKQGSSYLGTYFQPQTTPWMSAKMYLCAEVWDYAESKALIVGVWRTGHAMDPALRAQLEDREGKILRGTEKSYVWCCMLSADWATDQDAFIADMKRVRVHDGTWTARTVDAVQRAFEVCQTVLETR